MTKYMKRAGLLLICTACSTVALTQMGGIMDEYEKVIHLGAGLETGREMNGFTGHLGLDWSSTFNLDIDYTHTEINTDNQYTYDGTIDGMSALFTWWALHRHLNRSTDLQLGLKGGGGSYGYRNYQYWENEDEFVRYDGLSAGALGLELGVNVWLSDHTVIRPRLEALGWLGTEKMARQNRSVRDAYANATVKIGAGFLKKITPTETFYLEPSVLLNSYKAPAVVNLTLGYLIGF